jgi:hypothetical protein
MPGVIGWQALDEVEARRLHAPSLVVSGSFTQAPENILAGVVSEGKAMWRETAKIEAKSSDGRVFMVSVLKLFFNNRPTRAPARYMLEGRKPLTRLNDGCLAQPGSGVVLHI